MDKEISDTGEVKSVRNGSPKPDGTRSSRRKGTPRSHQAFMKQTLMDEGLRLAQGFNNGVDEYANPALQNYRLEDDHELRRAYGLKETIPVGSIKTEDFNTLTETTSVVSAGHIKREDFIKSEPLDDAALGLSGTDVSQVDGQENGHVEDEQQTEMAEDHTDTVQTDKSLNDSGMLQEADTQGQRTVKMEQVDMGQSLETSQGLEEEQDLTASQQYVLVSQQQDMAFPQDMLVQ